jgi:hypothetical protein
MSALHPNFQAIFDGFGIKNPQERDAISVDGLKSPAPADILENIVGHLGAILSQTIPSDDQIIIGHVKTAHDLASLLWHASRKGNV